MKKHLSEATIGVLLWFLLSTPALALYVEQDAGRVSTISSNRLIVKFVPDITPILMKGKRSVISTGISALDELNETYGVRHQSRLFPTMPAGRRSRGLDDIYVLTVEDGNDVLAMKKDYEKLDCVIYAEPDRPVELYDAPNDPLYEHQWALHNTGQGYYHVERLPGYYNDQLVIKYGMSDADIDANEVFENPPDNTSTVIVAIVDTGVDIDHPDLAEHIWTNAGEIPDNGIDDDHNGYVDDMHGWDFSGDSIPANPDDDPTDMHGHGTHCAGIVLSVTNNSLGTAGIVTDGEIMALKFYPLMLPSFAAEAIVYAADNGADVISMSWGLPYHVQIWEDALDYAREKGVILCAAAGNDGEERINYPAGYDNNIAVAASNSDDLITSFSTYGNNINVCAPGLSILSLRADGTDMYGSHHEPNVHIIDENYYLASGTSMACPHVAGVAAYLRSVSPGLTHDKARDIIEQTADDYLDPMGTGGNLLGWDKYSGAGRINLQHAIVAAPPVRAKIMSPSNNEFVSGTIQIEGTADGDEFANYVLEYGLGRTPDSWIQMPKSSLPVTEGILETWDTYGLTGTYTIRLRVGDFNVAAVTIHIVNTTLVKIDNPQAGDTVLGYVTISGTALCPGFDSLLIEYAAEESPTTWHHVYCSTAPAAGPELFSWVPEVGVNGEYALRLSVFSTDGLVASDTVQFTIISRFALPQGWRVSLGGDRSTSFTPNYGDFDNDGEYEIIVGTASGIKFFNPDGTIKTDGVPTVSSGDFRVPIPVGDLDADGVDDFVAVSDGDIYGFPSSAASFVVDANISMRLTNYRQAVENTYPYIMLQDIDNDGKDEIHCFQGQSDFNEFSYYLFKPDGSMWDCALPFFQYNKVTVSADIDGDSVSEIFGVSFHSRSLAQFDACANIVNRGEIPTESGLGFDPVGLSAVNIDDNEQLELILFGRMEGSSWGNYFLYAFDSNLNLLPGFPHDTGINGYWGVRSPVFGDFDGDGRLEYVVRKHDLFGSSIHIWRVDGEPFLGDGYGDGIFASVPDEGYVHFTTIGDISGDGVPDIVMAQMPAPLSSQSTQSIFAWQNDGQVCSGWPIVIDGNIPFAAGYPNTPVIGDLDQDGFVDLFMTTFHGDLVFTEFSDVIYDSMFFPCPMWRYNRRLNNIAPSLNDFPTSISDYTDPSGAIPQAFSVKQNFPNPFNTRTTIEFSLSRKTEVTLSIFNIVGQKVMTSALGRLPAGAHSVDFEGRDDRGNELPSGVYFFRLEVEDISETRKMVLLK